MSPQRCGAQLLLDPDGGKDSYAICDRWVDGHFLVDHKDFTRQVDWPACSQHCLKDHVHGRYRLKLGTPTGPASVAARAPKVKREKRKGEPRCEVCLQPGELKNGRCTDRVACLERAPELEMGI